MRLTVAAVGVLLVAAGCAGPPNVPFLDPNLTAAQISALPGKAGIHDAHYVSTFTGPDGTTFNALSGTVQTSPRGFTQVAAAIPGRGMVAGNEYREVGGMAYNQMLPGWTHPRWSAYPAPVSNAPMSGNPAYFDSWPQFGSFQVEGQEGSTMDRAWRLVTYPSGWGPQASLRIWVRQRDGYPLKYRMSFAKGATTLVFDRWNSGARVTAPAAKDLMPPPASLLDAGRYAYAGGVIRVLTVDYGYKGELAAAPASGSHVVGAEVYIDGQAKQSLTLDYSRSELVGVDGSAFAAQPNGGGAFGSKGGSGVDQVLFFTVPDSASGPFSLHVVLINFLPQSPSAQPDVAVDARIRLSQ